MSALNLGWLTGCASRRDLWGSFLEIDGLIGCPRRGDLLDVPFFFLGLQVGGWLVRMGLCGVSYRIVSRLEGWRIDSPWAIV